MTALILKLIARAVVVALFLLPSEITEPAARTARPSLTSTRSSAITELARSSPARTVSRSPAPTIAVFSLVSIASATLGVWDFDRVLEELLREKSFVRV